MEQDEIYGIIQAMREAKQKYCEDNGIGGSQFCADITIYETDYNFTEALRRVDDYEQGFARWWVINDNDKTKKH
jgi:hypothetical protein